MMFFLFRDKILNQLWNKGAVVAEAWTLGEWPTVLSAPILRTCSDGADERCQENSCLELRALLSWTQSTTFSSVFGRTAKSTKFVFCRLSPALLFAPPQNSVPHSYSIFFL